MFTTVPDKAINDDFTELMWDSYIRDNLNSGVVRPLADVPLSAAAASVDLQNIPQTFAHLLVAYTVRSDAAVALDYLYVRANNDAGLNYYTERVQANGAASGAGETIGQARAQCGFCPGSSAVAGVYASGVIVIPNYAGVVGASPARQFVGLATAAAALSSANIYCGWLSGVWNSGLAISRLTLLPPSGNLIAGSRITLYGMPL